MLNEQYFKNMPSPDKNILHEYTAQNLSNFSISSCNSNEFNNLLFNSNLEKSNMIK